MVDTKPSERAVAAAREIFEHIHFDDATVITETALIIDEHCPVQPAYAKLLAALEGMLGRPTTRSFEAARAAVAAAKDTGVST